MPLRNATITCNSAPEHPLYGYITDTTMYVQAETINTDIEGVIAPTSSTHDFRSFDFVVDPIAHAEITNFSGKYIFTQRNGNLVVEKFAHFKDGFLSYMSIRDSSSIIEIYLDEGGLSDFGPSMTHTVGIPPTQYMSFSYIVSKNKLLCVYAPTYQGIVLYGGHNKPDVCEYMCDPTSNIFPKPLRDMHVKIKGKILENVTVDDLNIVRFELELEQK